MNIRLISKNLFTIVIWIVALSLMVALVHFAGKQLLDQSIDWNTWLQNNATYFFIWRTVIYALTAYGWFNMRKRVLQRELSLDSIKRFKRTEIAALIAIIVFEAMNVFN